MREIKFRGKRLDGKGWAYGNLLVNKKHSFIAYYDNEEQYNPHKERIHPETIGQFTGLKDKNGNGIWEGDIVRFAIFDYNGADTQYKGVVKWVSAMFEIWHNTESEYYGSDGGFVLSWVEAQDDELEVIGNIHDHPAEQKEATHD